LYEYKDDFEKWGQATEEESDDIATAIFSKINAENFDLSTWTNKVLDLKVNADTTNA
jgi:hypothetical protein